MAIAALLCATTASFAATGYFTTREYLGGSTSGATLKPDVIYEVGNGLSDAQTITYSCADSNGLTVNGGDVTAICIPKNKKLVVKGSGSSGVRQTGGKAGIYVPSGNTLLIFGDGTLEVTGAPPGSGGNGSKGGDGWVAWGATKSDSDCWGRGGAGGAGGFGGGGYAPAIGANGGDGGAGGKGGEPHEKKSTLTSDRNDFYHSGDTGGTPDAGVAGGSPGDVYFLGNVKVTLSGIGSKVTTASSGGCPGDTDWCNLQTGTGKPGGIGYGEYHVGGGGGGGGGGSGGWTGYYVGGGGGGGTGGAGGGSAGGTYWERKSLNGYKGEGGYPAGGSGEGFGVKGGDGQQNDDDHTMEHNGTTYSGGAGGNGATKYSNNNTTGNLYISTNATCNIAAPAPSNSKREYHDRLTFHYELEQADGSFVSGKETRYGDTPTLKLDALPIKDGYEFLGYYTESGERRYNSDGTPVPKPYLFIRNERLYARMVESANFERTGVTVNGRDLAYESGSGWEWRTNDYCAVLSSVGSGETEHRLAGTNFDSRVRFKIASNLTVVFDNLCVTNSSTAAEWLFQVPSDKRLFVRMEGSSVLARTGDWSGGAGSVLDIRENGSFITTNDYASAGGLLELISTPATRRVVNIGSSGLLGSGGGRLHVFGGGTSTDEASVSGASGAVRIGGGTVRIGNANSSGRELYVKTFEVGGGSLHLAHGDKPTIASGGSGGGYRCITSAVPGSKGDDWTVKVAEMGVNGVTNSTPYGTLEIYPENGFVYLWQPDGHVTFSVDGMHAWVENDSGNTDALFADLNLRIDGRPVGTALGTGWVWMPTTSNLTFTIPGGTRVMTGSETNGAVHPVVDVDTTLKTDSVTLNGYGVKDGIIEVSGTAALKLVPTGTSTTIAGLDHFRGCGICVGPQASLEIAAEDIDVALTVTAGAYGAGIGGNVEKPGDITISCGTVTVTGGFEGAGIGGASGVDGGNVTVCGRTDFKATGGTGAPAIGGGAWAEEKGTISASGDYSSVRVPGHYAEACGDGNVDSEPAECTADTADGSTVVVDDAGDSLGGSSTTLRTAFARIAAGNVPGSYVRITFADSLAGKTISLGRRIVTGGTAANVTVEGRGLVTIAPSSAYTAPNDGGGAILHQAEGTLTLSGLAFTGFKTSGSGGAVYAAQPLTVTNCTFVGCTAEYYGGAVYAGRDCSLAVQASRFSGNFASSAAGGAVFARGEVTVAKSSFDVNYACFGGGAIGSRCSWGRTVVEHCSFLNNICGERGGGIDVPAGSAVSAACTFTGNYGGAVYAGEKLYAVSTISTGNKRYFYAVYPDAEPGIHATEFKAHVCTFGSVPEGTFTGTVQTNVSATALFRSTTNETYLVGGVNQVCRGLTHSNKAIVQGCYAWQAQGWTACGGSTRLSSTKTVLYGSSSPDIAITSDQLGENISSDRLLVGAVLASAEPESLVVDTLDDTEDQNDGLVSLREALRYAGSSDMAARASDGYREITFAEALAPSDGTIVITPTRGIFTVSGGIAAAINGGSDGRSVILRAPDGSTAPLFSVESGNGLAVENLTLRTGGTGPIVRAASDFTARYCCFDGEGKHSLCVEQTAGSCWYECCTLMDMTGSSTLALKLSDRTYGHAVGCTVNGNAATGSADVFSVPKGALFDFINCTLSGNTTQSGYLVNSLSTNGTSLVNCALLGNTRNGSVNDGSVNTAYVYYTTYGKLDTVTMSDPYKSSTGGSSASKAFIGAVRTRKLYGVNHRYFRPARNGSIYCNGAFAFHDSLWVNLAAGPYSNGLSRQPVRGSAGSAVWSVITDQFGRDIVQGYVSRGSYATCCDEEYFDEGVIEVNTSTDFTRHETAHDYDGLVTLREAVDFACGTPSCRDADGNCSVVFADDFFAGQRTRSTMLSRLYMGVTEGFTEGTLRIVGRTDRFTGVDGTGSHRILYIAPSNRVTVTGITFRNAVAETAGNQPSSGGAILNAGILSVTNCAFRNCYAGGTTNAAKLFGSASGGAVYTAGGGKSCFSQCTFAENTAVCGGGIYTASGARSVAVSSTFRGNRAVRGLSITSPYGGAVASGDPDAETILVNCTVFTNSSVGLGGGVYCRGGDDSFPTLYAVSSVIAGNVSASDAADLGGYGPVRLFNTCYGVRDGSSDARCVETACTPGAVPEDVLAGLEPTVIVSGGVEQDVYPLDSASSVCTPAFTRADAGWMNILCARSTSSSSTTQVRGNRNYARRGAWCLTDQLGGVAAEPFLGATMSSKVVAKLTLAAGGDYSYSSLGAAMDAASAGDTVTVLEEDASVPASLALACGVRLIAACADDAASERVMTAVSSGAAAYAADHPWYSVSAAGGAVTMALNEKATPTLDGDDSEVDLAGSSDSVSVVPGNVKPGLWYGLARSDTPVGPFTVEAGGWVQADEDGNLPETLTAPKSGASGFYRVQVTDNPDAL